jgi:uroporphyrinogen III methyltransferase/synthase
MTPGIVYLVGAGPGDPELLTLKGRRVLGEADAVVYDHLVDKDLLGFARPGCELIFAGKRAGQPCKRQSEIDETLVRLGLEGKTVVRLKGGDPFVFGRGGEEASALAAAGVPFEIVPGVTSALGAAAYAGIPLTHRDHASAVVLLTGHEDPEKPGSAVHWEDYAKTGATLCVYMGVKNLPTISERLIAAGMPPGTPAAILHAATTPAHRQVLGTVATLPALAAGIEAPAMIVIGEVAAYAEKLSWFEPARGAAHAR